MKPRKNKYHYIYKTTNLKGRYYIGMHSTDNVEDGYMGSGKLLKMSIKCHGKENHQFEILEYLPNRKALKYREAELVNEDLLQDVLCMNLCCGGHGAINTTGWVSVKDSGGNTSSVRVIDPRYMSGELIHISRGMVIVKDEKGKRFKVKQDDPRYLSGELISVAKGRIIVKDKIGECFSVYANDPRYLSGELVGATKGFPGPIGFLGKTHSEETKKKMGLANSKLQSGSGNSQFGTRWITNGVQNKKINKINLIPEGWKAGRICR